MISNNLPKVHVSTCNTCITTQNWMENIFPDTVLLWRSGMVSFTGCKAAVFTFFTYLQKNHPNHVNGLHKTFSQRIQIKNSPWYRAENVKPGLHIKTKCRQTSDILNLYINILHMYTFHWYQHYKIKHQYHYNDGYSALAHLSYFSEKDDINCHPHHTWQWETC